MRKGRFLVLERGGRLAGSVYVEAEGSIGYFGMLSIDPSRQKQGLGAALIEAAEDFCRQMGCTEMELQVVNLRTELPPYYRQFGYIEQGTRAFPDPDEATQPCHCIVMRKPL
jgi:GNAT superfamily N-acetyltransferase